MEDAENRLIREPGPIGTNRLEGQRCKYAEKSYMYKYDLGHTFVYDVVNIVFAKLYRERKLETERERGRCLLLLTAVARGEEEDRGCCLCAFFDSVFPLI